MFFYVYGRNVQTSQQVSLCVTAFESDEIFLLCLRVLVYGEYYSFKLISIERAFFWVVLETEPGDLSNHKQSSSFVLIGQLVKLAGHFKFHVSMIPPVVYPTEFARIMFAVDKKKIRDPIRQQLCPMVLLSLLAT